MEELKPCPFCGNQNIIIDNDRLTMPPEQNHIAYWGHCVACTAEGQWGETKEEAIKLWNTRIPPATASKSVGMGEESILRLIKEHGTMVIGIKQLEKRIKQS